MKKFKKTLTFLALFVILALPAIIFAFLRSFGDNQFDVPVYYEHGLEQREGACKSSKGQFYVDQQVIHWDKPSVHILDYNKAEDKYQTSNVVSRLLEEFDDNIGVNVYSEGDYENIEAGRANLYKIGSDSLDYLKKCIYLMPDDSTFVLIDNKRRIRGYYTRDLEEMDRLILELKILLENGGT